MRVQGNGVSAATQATADQRLIGIVFKKCDFDLHTGSQRRHFTTPIGSTGQPTTALVVEPTFAVPGKLDLDPVEALTTRVRLVFQGDDQRRLVAWRQRLLMSQRRAIAKVQRKRGETVAITLAQLILVVSVAIGDALIRNLWLLALMNDLSQ